jgi:hypothetical protein
MFCPDVAILKIFSRYFLEALYNLNHKSGSLHWDAIRLANSEAVSSRLNVRQHLSDLIVDGLVI